MKKIGKCWTRCEKRILTIGKMRLSLGYQVLIAVIAGILTGLFLGPLANFFGPVSSIYSMLLQMVVLPYITLSLIHGLGSLTPPMAKQLIKKGWAFWVLLWGVMFFVIFLVCYFIPKPISVTFVQSGTSLSLKEELTKNIITYLIPENPIYDFVNNIVPSIAIFGVIVGVALMHIEKKEPLLSLVERGDQIIEKILQGLAAISPIGVFAHISVGMGTIPFTDLNKISFYLISFILITLFLTFWVLPLILSSCTSLSFRDSVRAIRDVCTLPFLTGIPTIAIPFINLYLKKLGERLELTPKPEFRSISQTILPISYSFAQIGNGMLLFFILFASFYYRHPFTGSEKSLLSFLTIPLSVGSSSTSINAISFLFNELKFPDETMNLFTQTMPLTMNFQILLSIASVLTFILLVLFANYQLLQVKWKKFLFQLIGSLSFVTFAVILAAPYLHLEDNYRTLYADRKISDVIDNPITPQIYFPGEPIPDLLARKQGSVMDRILSSGVLRVGYAIPICPYAYLNRFEELVGFDIAMAYQLAQDLNCKLELIPADADHLGDQLNEGIYDIVMSAVVMSEDRILQMSFTDTYADQNYVLVVPEKNRSRFQNFENLQNDKDLVIGAFGGFKSTAKLTFPNAKLFAGNVEKGLEMDQVDAWIWSQVPATVWCLSHSDYSVADFAGNLGKCYVAYPVRSDAFRFLRFMNNWMQLKILDEFYKDQNDYWILGKAPSKVIEPRWSIIRNVLHWIK